MLLRYEFFYGVWTSFTYDRIFFKNYFKKKAIRWGIVLKETNVLIGTIGLNNLQLWSKRSEIGYDRILAIGEMVMLQKLLEKVLIMDLKI